MADERGVLHVAEAPPPEGIVYDHARPRLEAMPYPIPRGPFDQGLFLTHFNKGQELYEARRFDEAERQLEEAYLLRPRDPRVLNLLGLVYFRRRSSTRPRRSTASWSRRAPRPPPSTTTWG